MVGPPRVVLRPRSVATFGNTAYTWAMASTPSTANLLRDLRRQQGRSLRSAAADIGVAPSQLSRLERGQRGIAPDVSERLSSYYGVSADIICLAQGVVPADIVQILLDNPESIEYLRQRYGHESSG
jgi:transcriptional regulator with XRE-family HTH domain